MASLGAKDKKAAKPQTGESLAPKKIKNLSPKQWGGMILRRRIFVILLLLIQLIFVISIIFHFNEAFTTASYVLTGLSILVSFSILNRKKERSAYKLVWIFIILVVPIFGGLMYALFYLASAPRFLRRRIDESNEDVRPYFSLPGDVLPRIKEASPALPLMRYLQNYGCFPVYEHTRSHYFGEGKEFLASLLTDLEKAEKYIFVEFFILRQGKMLDPVLDIMEKKSNQGLDVRIMYDDLGCLLSLPPHFDKYLEKRGIKTYLYSPFVPIYSSQQNNRDHRKIVSIDGKVAYTGGMNLADEYINERERFGHWKDSMIRIEGNAAWSLTLIFLQMWNMESERRAHRKGRVQKDDFPAFYPWKDEPCIIQSDGYVQPYADSPTDIENVGENVYLHIISNTQNYLYINTPYLVFDDNLLSALILCAKSGVDLRIITPHRWDKWPVRIVSRSYYRQLIQAGVHIYEYSQGFNHSKAFVCDDKVATVGTTNLDFRSLYLHFECGVLLVGSSEVDKVKQDFLETLGKSHEISMADCHYNLAQRLFQDILRIFAPLM
jgi:cardiolipin synthase